MKFKLPVVLFPVLFYLVHGNDRPCNGIEVGRVKNNENPRLEELSGLAESHRYKDVFYSIEDSGNENVVYVINKNGTLKGQIQLPKDVKNHDFEDIAVSTEATGDYIYVGDIGNDWPNHCPGYNQTFRMVHVFREPNLSLYSLNNGTVQLETEKVTKLILKDAKASCSDELKADSEALFIDPITRNGYTIQKIRERNNARNPIIFKFHVPPPQSRKPKLVRSGDGNDMILGIEVELKRVGEIPKPMVFTNGHKSSEEFDKSFPTFITAGDISKDGSQIILRGKDEVKIWNRDINSGQTVEEVLSGSKGPFKTISLCEESGQGESISFRNDGKGFYTVSEAPDEDEAKDVNVPIFYYSLDEDSNEMDNNEGDILEVEDEIRSEEIDDKNEGCIPTDAGRLRGISSIWCNQNCANGRHPACKSSSGVHQFCECSDEDSSDTQNFEDSEGKIAPEIIDVTTDTKPHVSKLPDEEESCEDLFAMNKNAECILYDSTSKCNDRRFKALHSGGLVSYIENMWMHLEVDSISVRKGCRLTVFTGANFSGKYHPYTASNNNLHVLFQDEPHVALQNFSKNVNSAVCTCTVQPTYHPFSNQYYHSFSNYANHFTDKMLYPLLPYANFLHNRNWFYPSR